MVENNWEKIVKNLDFVEIAISVEKVRKQLKFVYRIQIYRKIPLSESHSSKVTGFKTVTLLQLRCVTGVFL